MADGKVGDVISYEDRSGAALHTELAQVQDIFKVMYVQRKLAAIEAGQSGAAVMQASEVRAEVERIMGAHAARRNSHHIDVLVHGGIAAAADASVHVPTSESKTEAPTSESKADDIAHGAADAQPLQIRVERHAPVAAMLALAQHAVVDSLRLQTTAAAMAQVTRIGDWWLLVLFVPCFADVCALAC